MDSGTLDTGSNTQVSDRGSFPNTLIVWSEKLFWNCLGHSCGTGETQHPRDVSVAWRVTGGQLSGFAVPGSSMRLGAL